MKVRYATAVAALALGALTALPAHASLLVTEFMPNPSGTDADREWMEIFNSGPNSIDLTGYAVGDGTSPTNTSAGEGMGVFPAGTVINAGQVMVIAADAEGFNDFYGFLPDFEFANNTSANFPDNLSSVPDLSQLSGWGVSNGTMAIANGGDDVAILAPGATPENFTFVDGANHGSFTTFYTGAATLGTNESYERVIANVDTDSVADWVVRASGQATPGVVSVPEPASLGLGLAGLVLVARRRNRR